MLGVDCLLPLNHRGIDFLSTACECEPKQAAEQLPNAVQRLPIAVHWLPIAGDSSCPLLDSSCSLQVSNCLLLDSSCPLLQSSWPLQQTGYPQLPTANDIKDALIGRWPLYRVAELELLRGHDRSDHDKLNRLEACTHSLVKELQLERDQVSKRQQCAYIQCRAQS